jgi:hypothetical protein
MKTFFVLLALTSVQASAHDRCDGLGLRVSKLSMQISLDERSSEFDLEYFQRQIEQQYSVLSECRTESQKDYWNLIETQLNEATKLNEQINGCNKL